MNRGQAAFAAALRDLRDRRGLTQQEVGDLVGLTGARVGQWESGGYIYAEHALLLERSLEAEPGELTHHLGYVPAHVKISDVIAAIRGDEALDELTRDHLVRSYWVLVKRSDSSISKPPRKPRKEAK